MTVIIPEHSGFCPGVSNAEKNIFRLKEREPGVRLYVYGYLINNRKYIAFLEEQGVRTVESMEDIPEGAVVIVRTHGLDRESRHEVSIIRNHVGSEPARDFGPVRGLLDCGCDSGVVVLSYLAVPYGCLVSEP